MRKIENNDYKEIIYSKEKQAGIYKIVNLINGKVYIGNSTDMYARKMNHMSSLRKGDHYGHYLQSSWNKYGESNFVFSIIESMAIDSFFSLQDLEKHLLKRETEEIQNYNSTVKEYGYNVNPNPDRSPMLGRKHTESTKKKMSEWQRGENNNNFGGNFSEQHRKNMSKARTGAKKGKMSEESKKKISDAHKFRGNKPSKEAIEKSHLLKQRKVVQLDKEGELINSFDSVTIASQNTECGRACITACCQGKQRTSKGFQWMYTVDYKEMKENI